MEMDARNIVVKITFIRQYEEEGEGKRTTRRRRGNKYALGRKEKKEEGDASYSSVLVPLCTEPLVC